jgi:GMP synthase (glutamine-hydrolysing)
VKLLSIIHGEGARSCLFGEVAEEEGHAVEEWSVAWEKPLSRPLDDYDAVFVFGGAMHADQDDRHPWLREEALVLQRILDVRIPVLGVCLGAQLLARAAHARVGPASQPEIGWFPVELTEAAADDPVLSRLPERFDAFQWHYYTYEVPSGAVELARSEACTQAFRLGDAAWAVQFHPEVTLRQIERWIADSEDPPPAGTAETMRRESAEKIGEWNELGRTLCGAFLEAAARVGTASGASAL